MSNTSSALQVTIQVKHQDFSLNAELTFPAQGVSTIFGPSGSGKTTILRCIAGLDRHNNCTVTMADKVWQSDNVFVPPYLRNIAYVFQQPELFPHLDVQHNIRYGLDRAGNKKSDRITALVELLGLQKLLTRSTNSLSGGEAQRVAIARALATDPCLLLMDEPLASLDQKRKEEILPFLETLHQELDIPVLYVSHSINEITRLADQLTLLRNGLVLGSGPVTQMLTRLDLPLAHRPDAEVILHAVVSDIDHDFNLMQLNFGSGQLQVPGKHLPLNTKVRIRLAAQDVSITLTRQVETSIQNIFAAQITEIKPDSESQAMLKLAIGEVTILARLTRKSIHTLGLKVGLEVYAQVKSVALLT